MFRILAEINPKKVLLVPMDDWFSSSEEMVGIE